MTRRTLGIAALVIASICVGIVILTWLAAVVYVQVRDGDFFRIPSGAMDPKLAIGDRVMTVDDDTPERGDIYVFHPPTGAVSYADEQCGRPRGSGQACAAPIGEAANETFIKRVVAVPGDRLKIVRNRVHVNGRRADEPNVRTTPCSDIGAALCNLPKEITIPPNHYFMMGDNRGQSADSREWGPVPAGWLVGRADFRYWPLGRLGSL